MCAWMCGSSEEGDEEEVQADSRRAWAVGWATSVSGAHAIYVHTHVHGGVAPGVVMQSGRSWAKTLSCKPLDTERGIILTCGYAGGFWGCSVGCAGAAREGEGEGKSEVWRGR